VRSIRDTESTDEKGAAYYAAEFGEPDPDAITRADLNGDATDHRHAPMRVVQESFDGLPWRLAPTRSSLSDPKRAAQNGSICSAPPSPARPGVSEHQSARPANGDHPKTEQPPASVAPRAA
jgi:hypothetical protein